MKKHVKILIAAAIAAATAPTFAACTPAPTESEFDNPRPWHDDASVARNGSYEKLNYTVNIYDTTPGATEDKRVVIATGTLGFELAESIAGAYTTLDMRYSVTYNDSAPQADRGLTDAISSTVRFSTDSLAAQYMQKTVTLADRAGADNLSYTVTAEYHGDQTATLVTKNAEPKTLTLSKNACHDNEMMFYLARAQAMAESSSTMFKLINVYESFAVGKITEYTLYAQAASEKTVIDMPEFVKDFGVEAVTDEHGSTTYPVSCYSVSIGRSGSKAGPPYNVLYTENAFSSGGKSHSKIPVRISYSEFKNNKSYRYFEYTLSSCAFGTPD